ncbi:hypothetical protein UFOVP435_67 [uncultured Caudovirales phage]|uniref:Uncharacterized protein n=1 Tax=uncultured Caudovirales phage TaxID=2100421 RepID=A0A6J5MAI0_9CAUD|nr:hypothetical protein UFOVP435_67 [uncultured Caudovirales phage]
MTEDEAKQKMVQQLLELIDAVAVARAEAITTNSILQDFIALSMLLVKRGGGSIVVTKEELMQFGTGSYVLVSERQDLDLDPAGLATVLRLKQLEQPTTH